MSEIIRIISSFVFVVGCFLIWWYWKKRIDRKKLITSLLVSIISLFLVSLNSNKNQELKTMNISDLTSSKVIESSSSEIPVNEHKTKEIIYKDNEGINQFLIAYNKANPENLITAEMFKVYNHHGTDHKDQIIFENRNNCKIVVTDSGKIKVVITRNSSASDEDFRNEFIRFGKAFDSKLSEETLISYLEQVSPYSPGIAFDEFELSNRGTYVVLDASYAKRK